LRLLFTGIVVGQHHSWATFCGWRSRGRAYDLKFELGVDFLTMHLPTKFHHHMFNRSEVIVLTNTETNRDSAENIHLPPLCYAGWKTLLQSGMLCVGFIIKKYSCGTWIL